jgi:hypothetical protein
MTWLLVLASLAVPQAAMAPLDVTKIEVGAPVVAAEIDTGKLKGEVRRLCWSPDGATLYLQTAEGNPPVEIPHHYSIAVNGGTVTPLGEQPDWAGRFWDLKQDRVAPGNPALVIEVVQGSATLKSGVGQAGVLDRSSSPDSVASSHPSADSLAVGNMGNERARVVRLTLLGHDIATWTNERPYPGGRFSWGPSHGDALVYVGEKGQLVFFDQKQHKRPIAATRDAVLPAWSTDGKRLAYLQKTGRKKYLVMWAPVGW